MAALSKRKPQQAAPASSRVPTKSGALYVNLNYLDSFIPVYRTTRFIESGELTYGPKLIRDARKLLSEQRAATQQ